jgi:outer membrane receptor protein involved in Fe transport
MLIAPVSALAQSEPAGSSDGPATQAGSSGKPAGGILDMDLEQLAKTPVVVPSMDIPVTSVTKELSTVGRSAAAVFVITNEMIRRSGATCIPDALRMAPGMEVAQINSDTRVSPTYATEVSSGVHGIVSWRY